MSHQTLLPFVASSAFLVISVGCSGTQPTPSSSGPAATGAVQVVPAGTADVEDNKSIYPAARRGIVVDNYHGTEVADPYRWLEDPDSDESRAWITGQNKVTSAFLASVTERDAIRKRLTELWNYERFSTPYKKGRYYFFSKNDGLQNQSVYYRVKKLGDEPEIVFDPNKWSNDGTVSLGGMSLSDNGRYAAYGVRTAGLDWNEWRVRDLKTGKDTGDKIDWIKFSRPSWSRDNRGFFYARYPAPAEGAEKTAGNFFSKVYYHRLGTEQSADELVHEDNKQAKYSFTPHVTDDGRYLILSTWKGTGEKNLVQIRDLRKKGAPFAPIVTDWIGEFSYIGNDRTSFYFKTNYKSPRSRLIAIDIRKPAEKNWKELIGESEDTLRQISLVGNTFIVNYMQHAKSNVVRFNIRGKKLGVVVLPGLGSASGFKGERNSRETFYSYTSYNEPSAIYRYDLRSQKSSLFKKPNVKFDGTSVETKQVFFKSKDGTKIPMFVIAKKGVALDGNNPTLLYGYGGFSIPLMPRFKVSQAVWLEMGGVLAVANLRGGGEYGEEWHEAGTKLRKQNVFDDFIAAAEYLVAKGYTKPAKLAIEGRSNGGLLVGAVANQRPDLFGAALPGVGVMDMLRYHKFTIGWAWVDDYGSSENPEEFKALLAYSPYHNLKVGTRYPTTMVTTADHDDRVVPGHSFKYAAALQHAHKGENPVLIRIETKAGHGAGTPTSKRIEQAADTWAFLVKSLKMKPTFN